MNEAQKKILIAALIFLVTMVSRLIFFEQHFGGFSYDSGSFTLAVQDYDLTDWRPHLPGYYLYVQTLKLFQALTSDIHLAMKWVLVLFSSLAMGLLYSALRRRFANDLAVLMVGITLTNPLVWYYGCVSEIYAFDLFFSAALFGLCYSPTGIYFTPFFLGFFSGFRPSSAVLLFPLYIFLWYRHVRYSQPSTRKMVIAHLAGVIGLLLWFIPMVETVGGLSNYISLYRTHNPVHEISLLQNWYRMSSYSVYILFPFFILGFIWLADKLRRWQAQFPSKTEYPCDVIRMLWWWLVPSLLFFGLFHYAKGYYLLIAFPIFGLTVFIFRNMVFARRWVLTVIIAIQTLFFVAMPYSEPDLQTWFSAQRRQMNLLQVWWERTGSVFLMAQSQIRALDETGREFEDALSPSRNESEFIFLDPTFPISARAMQAKYAHLQLTQFAYRRNGYYQLYSGLSDQSRQGFKDMLANALIVSRRDFVEGYLGDTPKNIRYNGSIVSFTIFPECSSAIADLYQHLFSRK